MDYTVNSLAYTYGTNGQLFTATVASDWDGNGTIFSQVQEVYNGLGQLTGEYQSHSGAVNTSTTPEVQYLYAGLSGPTGDGRPTGMVYPNGRVVDYAYGVQEPVASISSSGTTATATYAGASQFTAGDHVTISGAADSHFDGTFIIGTINTSAGTFTFTLASSYTGSDSSADITALDTTAGNLDNSISRIDGLQDHAGSGAGNLESYSYLGLNTIVRRTRGNSTQLTYAPTTVPGSDGGDQYTGLDRFGRVVDQNWLNTSTNTSTDRFTYAYDKDSNVLYKNNVVNSAMSELYSPSNGTAQTAQYDALNRLKGFARGTLSASGGSGTLLDTVSTSQTQSWTLDAVGNWTGFNDSSTSNQTRGFDARNEITSISGGGASYTPTFDANGNMTMDAQGHQFVYDAWNRIVTVKDHGGTTLETYTYDAVGRRITITNVSTSTTTDLYYEESNVIEERQSSTVTTQSLWGLGYVNDLILRDDNLTSGSFGKSGSGLGRRFYVQQDANFNVTSLTDTSGAVTQRFTYTPYGAKTTLDGRWAAVTTDTVNMLNGWQGGRQDTTTGFVHFAVGGYGRDYDVYLGRWVQQDPAGYIDGANMYQMELGNPANGLDPTGLIKMDPSGKPDVTFTSGDPNDPKVRKVDIRTNTGYLVPKETMFITTTKAGGDVNYALGTIQTDDGHSVPVTINLETSKRVNRFDYDCHGHTFGKDALWIDDSDVALVLAGDRYALVAQPQPGDAAVYRAPGGIEHSAVVERIDRDGTVWVRGKGGYQDPNPYLRPANKAWNVRGNPRNPFVPPTYYRKPTAPSTQPSH